MAKPRCDVDFVVDLVKPVMPNPQVILLGGSRSVHSRVPPVKSSDYNLIVLGEKVAPESTIRALHPHSGDLYDIIARDSENFHEKLNTSIMTGRSAFAAIGHNAMRLFGPPDAADAVRRACRSVLKSRPDKLQPGARVTILKYASLRLTQLKQLDDLDAAFWGRLAHLHQLGRQICTLSRNWVGVGKSLSRCLSHARPSDHEDLLDAYEGIAQDDDTKAMALAAKLGSISCPEVRYEDKPAFLLQSATPSFSLTHTYRKTFHVVRTYPQLSGAYLLQGERHQQQAVQSWMLWQAKEHRIALAQDRTEGARADEYCTALMSYAIFAGQMVLLNAGEISPTTSFIDRARLVAEKAPWMTEALLDAMEGKPALLNNRVGEMINRLAPTRDEGSLPARLPLTTPLRV